MSTDAAEACPALKPLIDWLRSLEEPAGLDDLHARLTALNITREDLGPYVAFSENTYARNRVAASGFFELLVVCWGPGQRSLIHDHTGSACAFKVIEGNGVETGYERTQKGLAEPGEARLLETGCVCASMDSDVHEVTNRSTDEALITLHIYTPPLNHMNTYDLDTACEAASTDIEPILAAEETTD